MKKILIIEDEESIRGFLKINLKRNGYEVIEADNGELGVKLALKEKPAIIILDVMLPGIDGFKVCKIIRNEDEKVGIIMLTAKSQELEHTLVHLNTHQMKWSIRFGSYQADKRRKCFS